jgi:hypothetical protein
MQEMTSGNRETQREHLKSKVQPENDVDREMRECLTRLKVWQTENLLAPHGMDKFAEEKKGDSVREGGFVSGSS